MSFCFKIAEQECWKGDDDIINKIREDVKVAGLHVAKAKDVPIWWVRNDKGVKVGMITTTSLEEDLNHLTDQLTHDVQVFFYPWDNWVIEAWAKTPYADVRLVLECDGCGTRSGEIQCQEGKGWLCSECRGR